MMCGHGRSVSPSILTSSFSDDLMLAQLKAENL